MLFGNNGKILLKLVQLITQIFRIMYFFLKVSCISKRGSSITIENLSTAIQLATTVYWCYQSPRTLHRPEETDRK